MNPITRAYWRAMGQHLAPGVTFYGRQRQIDHHKDIRAMARADAHAHDLRPRDRNLMNASLGLNPTERRLFYGECYEAGLT